MRKLAALLLAFLFWALSVFWLFKPAQSFVGEIMADPVAYCDEEVVCG